MKISVTKILGGAIVTLAGRRELPDYWQASVTWNGLANGSRLYIYAGAAIDAAMRKGEE